NCKAISGSLRNKRSFLSLAFFQGIPLSSPVCFEIGRNDERFYLLISHLMEQVDRRPDIRTRLPRPTSTIENNLTSLRYFLYDTFERLESGCSRRRSPKKRSGNVASAIQRHKSSEYDQRFRWPVVPNLHDQLLRLHHLGALPLIHGVRLTSLDGK